MILFLFIIFSNIFQNVLDFDNRMHLPRALALNGNLESRITLNESIYFNPASSAFARVHSIELTYSYFDIKKDKTAKVYNISLVDLGQTFIGGGIGFTYWNYNDNTNSWNVNGLVNRLLLNNRLGAGFSVSYSKYNISNIEHSVNLNVNFGLLYTLTKKTLLGFTAYNTLGDKNNINTSSFALSIRQTVWDFFSFSLAYNHDLEKDYNFIGSIEFLYKNGFTILSSIKKDYHYDDIFWGAGIGYNAPKLSLIFGTLNSVYDSNINIYSLALRSFF
jgi:hypothetical protein